MLGQARLGAIATGGVPMLIFLNPSWIRNAYDEGPNFFDVRWPFAPTLANALQVLEPLSRISPEVDDTLPIVKPLRFETKGGPTRNRRI